MLIRRRMHRVVGIAKRMFQTVAEKQKTVADMKNILSTSFQNFDAGLKEYETYREYNDVPDWVVVKLSSISMMQTEMETAEKLMKEQVDEYGGDKRQARNAEVNKEQICAAIKRVVDKDVDAGFKFYDLLKKYRFCSNRDVFLSILIQKTVETNGWKVGIEKLIDIMKKDNRAKTMAISAYYILESAFKADCLDKVDFKSESIIKKSTLNCLKLLILLEYGSLLQTADYCKRNDIVLKYPDVKIIVDFAGRMKTVNALLNLYDIDTFVNLPKNGHYIILEMIIKNAGKSGKEDLLEFCVTKVKNCKHLEQHEQVVLYSKIRHFYKCMNIRSPERLQKLIYRTNDWL